MFFFAFLREKIKGNRQKSLCVQSLPGRNQQHPTTIGIRSFSSAQGNVKDRGTNEAAIARLRLYHLASPVHQPKETPPVRS
jgi:hypothetical protein